MMTVRGGLRRSTCRSGSARAENPRASGCIPPLNRHRKLARHARCWGCAQLPCAMPTDAGPHRPGIGHGDHPMETTMTTEAMHSAAPDLITMDVLAERTGLPVAWLKRE